MAVVRSLKPSKNVPRQHSGWPRLALAMCLVAGLVRAQERTHFVFHVYVDPIFGDNDEAFALNPGNPADACLAGGPGSSPCLESFRFAFNRVRPRPLDRRLDFNASEQPTNSDLGISGVLQHAPYSFRTLSGSTGALEYVNRVFDPDPLLNGSFVLPWTNATVTGQGGTRPGNGNIATHVIVHCLPGLYGPRYSQHGDPEIDPVSGLPWNGEQLPIELGGRPNYGGAQLDVAYDRISIQGTSALDTIFDGRGGDAALPEGMRSHDIFVIRSPDFNINSPVAPQNEVFIDGITVRNAAVGASHYPGASHGAGILISGTASFMRPFITNCFFVDNVAGIAIDAHGALDNVVNRFGQHEPRIINNTFFNNRVGIWAGLLTEGVPAPDYVGAGSYVNTHDPLVINNIFWSDDAGDSAFEGISPSSLLVNRVDGLLITPMDFNAWAVGRASFGRSLAALPNWSNAYVTTGFAAPPSPPPPRVDIAGYRELFVGQLLDAANIWGDLIDHDLRLIPWATFGSAASPNVVNPLIGQGVNRAGGALGIRNQLGGGFAGVPGLAAGAESAPVHGWDYDCEGFGNPRLLPRSGIPDPLAPFGTVDLGADQCGGLIIAGYLHSTRILQVRDAETIAHDRILLIDTPSQSGLPRPDANFVIGLDEWGANVRRMPTPLDMELPLASSQYYPAAATSYYTYGKVYPVSGGADIWTHRVWLQFFQGSAPFMRNLACDFSPHLLMDCHPFWGYFFEGLLPWTSPIDPYACNPTYFTDGPYVSYYGDAYPDNPSLFTNLGGVPHGVRAQAIYPLSTTAVYRAHVNPPGSFLVLGGAVQYLFGSQAILGPIDPVCGSPGAPFSTDAFGVISCHDRLPNLVSDFAIRVNAEIPSTRHSSSANTNLQTFLAVLGDRRGAERIQGAGASASFPESGSTVQLWSASMLALPAPQARLGMASFLGIPPQLGSEADFRGFELMTRIDLWGGR